MEKPKLLKNEPSITYFTKNGLYLNVTNRCDNKCIFCLSNFSQGLKQYNLMLQQDPGLNEVWQDVFDKASGRNFEEIVYCGFGEPLLRLDDIVSPLSPRLKQEFSKPIRVDTNGHVLYHYSNRNIPKELVGVGVSRISVSLNAENCQVYNKLCRPNFIKNEEDSQAYELLLKFISQCSNQPGLKTEATAVDFPEGVLPRGIPVPDMEKCEKVAHDLGVSLRVRTYQGPRIRRV